VDSYYRNVDNAEYDNFSGAYVFPCGTSLPSFSLVIDGAKRTVPGQYIEYADAGGGYCYGGIIYNTGIGFSIFGDIFLKSQYVVFDDSGSSPRIGFGQQA
jgi:aspergillopepsin I